jgi:hypothetical protein
MERAHLRCKPQRFSPKPKHLAISVRLESAMDAPGRPPVTPPAVDSPRDGSARPGPLQTAQARHLAHGRSLSPCPAGGSATDTTAEEAQGGTPELPKEGGLAPSLRQSVEKSRPLPCNVQAGPGFSGPGVIPTTVQPGIK